MAGLLPLLVPVLFAVAPVDDAAAKEQAQMQGTWRIVQFELGDDTPMPPDEEIKKGRLIIQGNKLTPRMGDGMDQEAETFTLDPAKNPKAIDMTTTTISETRTGQGVVERKKTKSKMLGIYKIDGDRLTLCFTDADRPNEDSKERPTEFSVKGQKNRFLMVLERVKEEK